MLKYDICIIIVIKIGKKIWSIFFKKTNILEKKNSRQRHTIGLTTFFDFSKNILKRILYGSLKLAGFEGMNLS